MSESGPDRGEKSADRSSSTTSTGHDYADHLDDADRPLPQSDPPGQVGKTEKVVVGDWEAHRTEGSPAPILGDSAPAEARLLIKRVASILQQRTLRDYLSARDASRD
jgi:hypothetical protein